jgi:hypothetical protein
MKRKKKIHFLLKYYSYQRKIRRSNRKRKQRNILNNQQNLNSSDKVILSQNGQRIENIRINAGTSFSLLEKPENVIQIVKDLDQHKTTKGLRKNIHINLSNILTLDIGAISFLLAKVNEMSRSNQLFIWGNKPIDDECRNLFNESGFLDYMTDLTGKRVKRQSDNYLINVGADRTSNELVGRSIEKSMKFLTGEEGIYPPVYSIIQEICSNSVEWAKDPKDIDKNWLLGINFETLENSDERFITFTVTDVGYGILKTLKRKFGTLIAETMINKPDTDILLRAFDKKYGSKTLEINRNRGLPLIKDRIDRKFIRELKVITNNVFLDFHDKSNSKVLMKNLPGTFYFWKLDINCIEEWKKIKLN